MNVRNEERTHKSKIIYRFACLVFCSPYPPFPITRIPYPKKFEILSTLTSSLVKSKLLLVNE